MPEADTKEMEALMVKADLICKTMKEAVREAFELKVKLGHNAVIADKNGQPKTIGPEEIAELLKTM